MARKKTTTAVAPTKNKRGRPRKTFDLKEVAKVASLQCTYEEAAAFFECSVDTIRDRVNNDPEFSQVFKSGREQGKLSVRRAQYLKGVVNGNVTMLIWLGKQWLGQKDHVSVDATVAERTGVAHVPPEVTLEYWEERFGKVEVDVDVDAKKEPN